MHIGGWLYRSDFIWLSAWYVSNIQKLLYGTQKTISSMGGNKLHFLLPYGAISYEIMNKEGINLKRDDFRHGFP